jgi:hypothetical protein
MKNKLILAGIVSYLIVGSVCSLTGADQVDKKPVGVWKFDESEGVQVKDSSENGVNGTISKDMLNVKRVEGKSGMALSFNLNDKKNGAVVLPGVAEKNGYFAKGMTVEAWIKMNSTLKREGTFEIVSNTVSDRGPGVRLLITWGMLALRSGEGDESGKTWEASSKPSTHAMKPDVWYHVAGVYDGSVFSVYLDGELVGQSEPEKTLTKGTPDIYIGSYNNGYAYGFDGLIDEVAIYDYPRTAVQILGDSKK